MEHRPARRTDMARNRRRLRRSLALALVALAATGCDGKWARGGWPEPVTVQGKKVLGLWQGSLVASLVIGGLVMALILGSALLFRRRGDELPRQVRYNLPIEVLYTAIPVVIVSVLFYFTAIRENDEDKLTGTPQVAINVVGFQWDWQFNYLDNGLSVTGRPGQPPQFVLPVGETIRFYETSPDVIHSFWVIPFLFKRDVIPGRVNEFQITITKTGTFAGKCAEYCGIDHDRMLFSIKAVSPSDYQAWLASAKSQAAQGNGDPEYTSYSATPQDIAALEQAGTTSAGSGTSYVGSTP